MASIRPAKKQGRGRRQLQSPNEDVRARLLDAGARLLAENGFQALRIDELAAAAQVSVGTFYLYFEGKDDLFVQLVKEFTEQLRERFRAASEAGGTVIERLERGLDAYFQFAEENRRGFLHFRDSGVVDTTGGRLSTWAMGVHARDLRPLLEEGMAAGELRMTDAGLLAQAVVGLVQHMAGVWLEHPDEVTRDQVHAFVLGLIASGVRPIEETDERG